MARVYQEERSNSSDVTEARLVPSRFRSLELHISLVSVILPAPPTFFPEQLTTLVSRIG